MIDHLEIQSRKIDELVRFYTDVLTPLGYRQILDNLAKGFGKGGGLDFFIVDGDPSENIHFAFRSDTRELVDAIYEIGPVSGHTLDRAPALAPHVHPNYYAGYLRDPDGHLAEFVCHAAK